MPRPFVRGWPVWHSYCNSIGVSKKPKIMRKQIYYETLVVLSNGSRVGLVKGPSIDYVRKLTEETGIKAYEVEVLECGDCYGDKVLGFEKYRYDEDLAQYLLV